MADPWDEEPTVDPWDIDPRAKTYGPVNPNNVDAQNAKAHFDAAARQQEWDRAHGRTEDPRVMGGAGFVVDEHGNAHKARPTIEGGAAGQNPYDPDAFNRAATYGALNAGTLGWDDEIAAAVKSGALSGKKYEAERDASRAFRDRVKAGSPAGDFVGNLGGGMVGGAAMATMLPATSTAMGAGLTGAGLGGVQGAGESREKTTRGVLADAGYGAVTGGATAALLSRLVGGAPSEASDRIDRATAHELGIRTKRGDKGNLAIVAKRYMNETPEQAALADEIDSDLDDAIAAVNQMTPGSKPITARDITSNAAKQSTKDTLKIEKSLAQLARETGLDPLAKKWTGKQLEDAAAALAKDRGRQIGANDRAIQEAIGGVRTRDIDNSLQGLKNSYDKDFSDLAMHRVASAEKMQSKLNSLYPDNAVRNSNGEIIAPRALLSPEIPVTDFRRVKSNVAKSAHVGNAPNNPGIAKEGEQELSAAMNATLKSHIASAAQKSPELAAIVEQYPALNKDFSFASAVQKAAKYRAEGEGLGQVYSKETFQRGAPLTSRAYDAALDTLAPAAQKRDRLIAYLMRLGESESTAKKLASKVIEKGLLGVPQGSRQALVHAIASGPKQDATAPKSDDSGINQWTPDGATSRTGNGADDWAP